VSRKTWITLAVVLIPVAGLVVASIFGAGHVLQRFHNANFIIAFAIGATLTVLLSVGLFSLTFLSSRRGYDDEVGHGVDAGADLHVDDGKNGG
jgi:hypothetical protein